ncbi:MAG: uroporphyrinogen-III synthase [Sphingomonadales bacterium]|nr:uroporphyrinogen-III synthase [Sphingomonadales bacterium]
MAVPLVIIRPEPGCTASLAALQAMPGVEAHGFPLFDITPRSWDAVRADQFDALLVGSPMVFRHGGPALDLLHGLPVYAVGEITAEAARAAGFQVAADGGGTLQNVMPKLEPTHYRLLRLAGEERVALNLPKGVSMEERVVYASKPRELPVELIRLLNRPAIVAVHSAEAARHLAAQCVRHGIRRAPLRIAALSARIAAAAGDGWGEVATIPFPEDKALLALARQMCQDPWPGALSGVSTFAHY